MQYEQIFRNGSPADGSDAYGLPSKNRLSVFVYYSSISTTYLIIGSICTLYNYVGDITYCILLVISPIYLYARIWFIYGARDCPVLSFLAVFLALDVFERVERRQNVKTQAEVKSLASTTISPCHEAGVPNRIATQSLAYSYET